MSGAVLAQGVGLADAVDADDVAEVPGAAGLHAGQRVLEHRRLARLDAERLGAGQERVGRRLALEVLLVGDLAVDPRLEQVLDPGGLQHVLAVRAGGDDGAPQPGVAGRLDVAHRARRRPRRPGP